MERTERSGDGVEVVAQIGLVEMRVDVELDLKADGIALSCVLPNSLSSGQ